jgi:hypothetical protein
MSTQAADPNRTPEQIRRDIEQHRRELGDALANLKSEFKQTTDWRAQIVAHQQQVLIGAAVLGFVLGGGLSILGSRRRRRAG